VKRLNFQSIGPRLVRRSRRALRVAAVAGVVAMVGGGREQAAWADRASTSIEQGYDLGEIQSPRAIAFGGAQTALGTSTTALYGNPANLPLARVYHFEGLAAFMPEAKRQSYGAGVVDSSTGRLAGGVGGTWNIQDPEGIHRQWTDLRLALAYPLGDRFSVGAAGRYLRADQGITSGPLGQSYASDGSLGSPIFNSFTFDLGLTVLPLDGLRIGAVGHNLTNPGTGLAPTVVQGGVGYGRDIFSIEGDAAADFTTWKTTKARAMLGGELFLAGHAPLRLGYRYDDGTKTHALSGGLGYVDRHWSFEVSGRHDVSGEHPSTIIGASLRLFYNASGGGELDTSNDVF
jgi:hypothetical protein